MSIEKKSLISTLKTTKKANVASAESTAGKKVTSAKAPTVHVRAKAPTVHVRAKAPTVHVRAKQPI